MWIILAIIAVLVVFAIFTYNRLVTLRQAWKQAYADIDVQLRQRQDLVPNLVETVKGYAAHESGVFTAVTQARASAMGARTVGERSAAEGVLTSAIGNLMAVAENYPQLKATANFRDLQAQLEGTENRITVERQRFNEAAQAFNTARNRFPMVLIAGMFGDKFASKPYFTAEPGSQKAPQVTF